MNESNDGPSLRQRRATRQRRVAEIRAAFLRGDYPIDADALAARLLEADALRPPTRDGHERD